MSLELLLASSNRGKIAEISSLIEQLSAPVTLLEPAAVLDVEETGLTYLDNARLKARAYLEANGIATLAEDSGIEVDALGGRPGVRSARFSGEGATDAQNNALLVNQLEGIPSSERTARYRAVAVVLFPDGSELVTEGVCEGRIATEPRGSGGFGYDPWFIPDGHSKHMAELSPYDKNRISHRGLALEAMFELLLRR